MRILAVAPQPFFQPRGTPFSVLHRIRALAGPGHSVDDDRARELARGGRVVAEERDAEEAYPEELEGLPTEPPVGGASQRQVA